MEVWGFDVKDTKASGVLTPFLIRADWLNCDRRLVFVVVMVCVGVHVCVCARHTTDHGSTRCVCVCACV